MDEFEAHLGQRGIQFDSSKSFKIILMALPDLFRISSNPCVIEARTSVKICRKYSSNVTIKGCRCKELHVCKFYLTGRCLAKHRCIFNHDMMLPLNQSVLKHHFLHKMSLECVGEIISDINNRNSTTSPTICKYYNSKDGCKRTSCQHLHICLYFVRSECKFGVICKRKHHFKSDQCFKLLLQYGLSNFKNEFNVLFRILRNNMKDGHIVCKKNIEMRNKPATRLFKKIDGKYILRENPDGNVQLGNVRKHTDEKETSPIESSNLLPIESVSQMANVRGLNMRIDEWKTKNTRKRKNRIKIRKKYIYEKIKKPHNGLYESESENNEPTVEKIFNRRCHFLCNETCENTEDTVLNLPTTVMKSEALTCKGVKHPDEAFDMNLQHQDLTKGHAIAGLTNHERNVPLTIGESGDSIQLETKQDQKPVPSITHVTKTEEQNNAPLEDSGSTGGTKTQEETHPVPCQGERHIGEAFDMNLQHQDSTKGHVIAGLKTHERNVPLTIGESADSIQLEIKQDQNPVPIITYVIKTEEQNHAPLEDSGSMDVTNTQEETHLVELKMNDIAEMNAETFENKENITPTLESADNISDELAECSHASNTSQRRRIQISVDDKTYNLSFVEDNIKIKNPCTAKEVLTSEEIKNKLRLSTSGLLEALEQFEEYWLNS